MQVQSHFDDAVHLCEAISYYILFKKLNNSTTVTTYAKESDVIQSQAQSS